MVEIWVKLIEAGKRKIEDAPGRLKDAIVLRLEEDGFETNEKTDEP